MVSCSAAFPGCDFERRDSIRYLDSPDPLITNGVASDRAEFNLRGCKRAILPAGTTIVREQQTGKVTLRMKKHLELFAHPVERITIDERRMHMGCAVARTADQILVSTFGEYTTGRHGGPESSSWRSCHQELRSRPILRCRDTRAGRIDSLMTWRQLQKKVA